MTKKALIAAWGKLPRVWAEKALAAGEEFIILKIAEEITVDFSDLEVETYTINLGQLTEILNLLKNQEIEEIIWLGKIQKARLFANFKADPKLQKLLLKLPNLNDDTILAALAEEFAANNFKLLSQDYLLKDQLAERGFLLGEVDSNLKKDLEYAFKTAYNLGRFDIGQTALVKDQAVMALEAIEGTDQAIKRAAKFGGSGVVMGKCSKKEQDFRFDIPTVGLKTISELAEAEAAALIIEADKTFILNKEEFCRQVKKEGIVVASAEYNKGEIILPWQK